MTGPDTRVFTHPDAWVGGSYDLVLDLAGRDDELLERTLSALWSHPSVEGCHPSRDAEPAEQGRVVPGRQVGLEARLYGLAQLSRAAVVPCETVVVREDGGPDWVYLSLPLGSLARVLPIDGYPVGPSRTSVAWRVSVDAWLRGIAESTFQSAAFGLGMVGAFCYGDGSAAQVARHGVPADRPVGFLVPRAGSLDWYPATR